MSDNPIRTAEGRVWPPFSSMGGRMSFPGVGAYSATKHALEGLSEALVAEVAPHGIDVLVVEPGAFRTGLTGGAQSTSAPLDAYDETVGPFRTAFPGSNGKEPGDPAKAAAAIIETLAADLGTRFPRHRLRHLTSPGPLTVSSQRQRGSSASEWARPLSSGRAHSSTCD